MQCTGTFNDVINAANAGGCGWRKTNLKFTLDFFNSRKNHSKARLRSTNEITIKIFLFFKRYVVITFICIKINQQFAEFEIQQIEHWNVWKLFCESN